MCRLLGIVANEKTNFHFTLHAAPRSLASLSGEHPHGWGIAVYDSAQGWTVKKQPVRASECRHFYEASTTIQGELLVAHVRSRTRGKATLVNTHPFRWESWLFAHNGTIVNTAFLRAQTSAERLRGILGQTDSELFFAYLLTQLDDAGVTAEPASERTDGILNQAMQKARSQPGFGACNFLLSDGNALYAHRFGRTLFVLERSPLDEVRVHRASHETGAAIDIPWTEHRQVILIASEEMTEEPWAMVAEGTLLRADRKPQPSLRIISGGVK